MGYHVALLRGGVPNVDVLVGSSDGRNSVTIQVKTLNEASSRAGKKDPKKHPACWCWPIGAKAKELRGKTFFYAFVNLNGAATEEPPPAMSMPDVFIVPADDVAKLMTDALPKGSYGSGRTTWVGEWKGPMYFFYIESNQDGTEKGEQKWREAWHLIREQLGDGRGSPVEHIDSSGRHRPPE